MNLDVMLQDKDMRNCSFGYGDSKENAGNLQSRQMVIFFIWKNNEDTHSYVCFYCTIISVVIYHQYYIVVSALSIFFLIAIWGASQSTY